MSKIAFWVFCFLIFNSNQTIIVFRKLNDYLLWYIKWYSNKCVNAFEEMKKWNKVETVRISDPYLNSLHKTNHKLSTTATDKHIALFMSRSKQYWKDALQFCGGILAPGQQRKGGLWNKSVLPQSIKNPDCYKMHSFIVSKIKTI